MLYQPAGWSAEAEDAIFLPGQPGAGQLPTAAAELIIKLVTV